MTTRRLSAKLREDLEGIYSNLFADWPYASPEGMEKLKKILGYEVDAEGNRIVEELTK